MAGINWLFTILVTLCLHTLNSVSEPFDCIGEKWFNCTNSRCIWEDFKCDGSNDCGDNSDERNCHKMSASYEELLDLCRSHEFPCSDRSCIPFDLFCDGREDCSDGTDEMDGCIFVKTCKGDEFQCQNGHCVQPEWKCDNENDCGDDSDELNCEKKRAPLVIVCRPGFTEARDGSCQDIDECKENSQICHQRCLNKPGSYECLCDVGYELQNDNKTCKVNSTYDSAILVFSSKTAIRGLFLKSNIYFPVVKNLWHANAVSVDANYVYWSDIKIDDETIFRSRTDGTHAEAAVTTGLGAPEEIAIDWVTGNIYFTDSIESQIGVCTDTALHCTVILKDTTGKPKGLALYPQNSTMYWSDWEMRPQIFRAQMDGKNASPFVSHNLEGPHSLTIDYPADRLYWVDAKRNVIESITLEGTDRKVIVHSPYLIPFSIAVFEDKLYWSDWKSRGIEYCNKVTGKNHKPLVKEVPQIYGIHIYHPVMKTQIENPCALKPCSDICLLSSNHTYSCACPLEKKLDVDNKTCKGKFDVDKLIVATEHMFAEYSPQLLGNSKMISSFTSHKFGEITYDSLQGNFLFFDRKLNGIARYGLQMHSEKTEFTTKSEMIGGMSFDKYGNNLYYTDLQHQTVVIHSLATSKKVIFHSTEKVEPVSIVVVPQINIMYVAFCSIDECRINETEMTGTGESYHLAEDDIHGPRVALAYDEEDQRIFWADQGTGRLESISIEGNERMLHHTGLKEPMSIAILGDSVFWTLKNTKKLYWSNKRELFSKIEKLTHSISEDVYIMHLTIMTGLYERGSHACHENNGGCSDVCLVSSLKDHVCACSPGTILSSDERTCHKLSECSADEFECSFDNSCIKKTLMCNGISDCFDGEDEGNCIKIQGCSVNEFRCQNGQCISKFKVCDERNDCADFSDETNCAENTCDTDSFKCSDSGICIPRIWECDGEKDCPNGSDESENCLIDRSCGESMFHCTNRVCVDESLRCDTIDDCNDNSDEKNCSIHSWSGKCSMSEYSCFGTEVCIPMDQKCDGIEDCPNNDDERHCSHCRDDKFACENFKCIPIEWVCDGRNDCGDYSDEKDCFNHKAIHSTFFSNHRPCREFTCKNGVCMKYENVCDGVNDCYDGSDENGLCEKSCPFTHSCEQGCQRTPAGSVCICKDGFKIGKDQKKCEDIDECELQVCSQKCVNKIGSYECSCFEGYVLSPNRFTCKFSEDRMNIIAATKDDIRIISSNYTTIEVIHRELNVEITGLDIHFSKKLIYWSNELLGYIHLFNLESKEQLITKSAGRPRILAVDWITDNVYYYNTEKPASISVCNVQEQQCTSIVKINGSATVLSLTVDPINGWVFWSQTDFAPYIFPSSEIFRSNMDGTNVTLIVNENLGLVTGLAIDHQRSWLYWTDAELDHVEKSKLNGSDRQVFQKRQIHEAIGINIFEDSIYWLEGRSGVLRKCYFFGRQICHTIPLKTSNFKDLFVISHPSRQPKAKNYCEGHKCDFMCVLKPGNSSCICPYGLPMFPNGTCPTSNGTLVRGMLNLVPEETRVSIISYTGIIIAIAFACFLLFSCQYYENTKMRIEGERVGSIYFQNSSYGQQPEILGDGALPFDDAHASIEFTNYTFENRYVHRSRSRLLEPDFAENSMI